MAEAPENALPETEPPIVIRRGGEEDRPRIYRKRHRIFATELGQHPENPEGMLKSDIDAYNQYLVAEREEDLVGFISLTPSSAPRFAIEKYWSREELPFALDEEVFELRLFVVDPPYRRRRLGYLLCHAAWLSAEAQGARRFALSGHGWERDFYARMGARGYGLTAPAGALRFELMTIEILHLRLAARAMLPVLLEAREELRVRWELEHPFEVE